MILKRNKKLFRRNQTIFFLDMDVHFIFLYGSETLALKPIWKDIRDRIFWWTTHVIVEERVYGIEGPAVDRTAQDLERFRDAGKVVVVFLYL